MNQTLQALRKYWGEELKVAYGRPGRIVYCGLGLALTGFILWNVIVGQVGLIFQRGLPLLVATWMILLWYPLSTRFRLFNIVVDLSLAASATFAIGHLLVNYRAIVNRIGMEQPIDIYAGIAGIIFVLEITRRTSGWALPIVTVGFLLLARFGSMIPFGPYIPALSTNRIVRFVWLTTSGVFGTALAVMTGFLFLYLLLGALLEQYGGGKYLSEMSLRLTGRVPSGPAQGAVVASGLFGSINGSAVANAVSTGNFTIPIMYRAGYTRNFAAAVEATASSGGQLMPPVMGATAFLIAEFLGIPYIQVISAALIPALLFYLGVSSAVYFEARRQDVLPLGKGQLPTVNWIRLGHYIPPLLVLVYVLWQGYSPARAGLVAIVTLLLLSLVYMPLRAVMYLLPGLIRAAQMSLQLWAIVACIGIIIAGVTISGIGPRASSVIVTVAGNSLWVLLALTAIASLIMGMGLPTLAAYIVLTILIAPAIIEFGVTPLGAHLFVFYFGILSSITPPVALASYAAAGVAGSNPMRTSLIALRLGAPGFLIPFAFVTRPELMLGGGGVFATIVTVIAVTVGIAVVASGFSQYLFCHTTRYESFGLVCGGILVSVPSVLPNNLGNVGWIAIALIVGINAFRARRDRELSPSPPSPSMANPLTMSGPGDKDGSKKE